MAGKTKQDIEHNIISARKTDELRTLLEISHSLHEYRNLNDLINYIIRRITGLMLGEVSSVILHDEEENEFICRWSSDLHESTGKTDRARFPSDKGIAGSVFKSGKAELVLDVSKDPRHYKKIDESTNFSTKSMMAVPLKTKEKTIGVLEVLNKRKGIFDQQDLDFLVTLAPIVAMALDNARMYAALEKAYRELQRIAYKELQLIRAKNYLIKQTQDEVALLQRQVERRHRFDEIIGNSEPMLEVFRLCEKVMDSNITVLIEGETGTGKELIARTIHHNSPRRLKPFVATNCGGIPDTLLESELFGHKKGAFTGAFSDRKGLFEIANGGTVFLDEIGEMSPAMQTSLLRTLQEREIKPLGADVSKKVDVRVISATHRNLETDTAEQNFRQDLLYRLNVFTVKLPPLRERIEDIPILADHFINKFNKTTKKSVQGLSREALQCLTAYQYPGNVRELENEIERAVLMAKDGKPIHVLDLSEKTRKQFQQAKPGPKLHGTLKEMVETLERSVVSQTLQKHQGNRTRAAKELGLSRYGLTKKIRRYGL